jgi:hypothetical protein
MLDGVSSGRYRKPMLALDLRGQISQVDVHAISTAETASAMPVASSV